MLSTLLLPLDLTPGSDRVVGRIARLPLAPAARLTLMHVVPRSLPVRARARAERDARTALELRARMLAEALPPTVTVRTLLKVGAPASEISRAAGSVKAELIVMGRGSGRGVRDFFLGSTAERVIRHGQRPVLVVRLPSRTPYVRPALSLELDDAAHEVLALMLKVIPAPRPRVGVIHAYEAPFHGLVYPSLSMADADEYSAHYRKKAAAGLARLLAAGLARAKVPPAEAPSWKMHVFHGAARLNITKAVKMMNADLLVLGTHGRSGIAHAFLGTVAGDVLREVSCDVLVVPPRRNPARPG